MAGLDRRKKLTIDQVNIYWRKLKDGVERPELHVLCNAIRTLDLALADYGPAVCKRLTANFWSRIRNDCFDILVSSFPGHFIVYDEGVVVEPGAEWPGVGSIEFYPDKMKRREDAFEAEIQSVHEDIVMRLRWCLADGRTAVTPADFTVYRHGVCESDAGQHEDEVNDLYSTCAEEASKLKKIAHRQWFRLQSEASNCSDRRHRSELRRQMDHLELVWGKSL